MLRPMRRQMVDDDVHCVDEHVYDEVVDSNEDDDDVDDVNEKIAAGAQAERISESVPNLSEYSNRQSTHVAQRPTQENAGGHFVRSSAMRAVRLREKSAPRIGGAHGGQRGRDSVVMVTSKPPPFADRSKSSSAVQLLLSEREMPITRERYSRSPRRGVNNKAMSFDSSSGEQLQPGAMAMAMAMATATAATTTTAAAAAERTQMSSGGGVGSGSGRPGLAVGGLRPPSHSDVPRRRSSKDAQKIR